jgi:hypothetical protein
MNFSASRLKILAATKVHKKPAILQNHAKLQVFYVSHRPIGAADLLTLGQASARSLTF